MWYQIGLCLGLIWILINLDRLDLVLIGQDRLAWIHLIQLDPLDPALDPLDPTLDPLDLERQDWMSVKPLIVRVLLRSTFDPPSVHLRTTFRPPSVNLRHRSFPDPPSIPFDLRRPILFGALSFSALHHNRPLSVPTSTQWLRREHRAPSLSRTLDRLFRFVMVVVPHGSPAIYDAFCPSSSHLASDGTLLPPSVFLRRH